MRFHLFGDSHASTTISHWGKIKNPNITFVDQYIGGKLAYSFGKKKFEVLNIKEKGVVEGDYVCFCFGETDMRCHVFKQISITTKTYEQVIDEIVQLYISAIKENVEQFKNIKTFIYNVVPPSRYLVTHVGHPFPYLGTDDERKMYYNYMNKKLEKECILNGYVFIDIQKYADENGFLNKKYSDGDCHIVDPIFVEEWFNNYFKINDNTFK